MKYRVGIDLGGTNIVSGVVDENYNIIAKAKLKTNCPRSAQEIIADMAKTVTLALEKAGIDISQVDSVGVGAPGSIEPKSGIVLYSNNIDFNNVELGKILSNLLGKPIFVENDANAAAYGEYLAGAGKGTENFVMITLGTGVGGGIIIDGKLLVGSNYSGGELGHTVIVEDGEQCTCGRRGCWEAYASATALIRQTKEQMLISRDSIMWQLCEGDIEKVNGLTAFDAMRAGDASGKQVVDKYINHIATGVVNLVNIFQPDVLCIGGGICNEGEVLTAPIEKKLLIEDYARYVDKKAQIKTATLGNDAGIIGAAFLGNLR